MLGNTLDAEAGAARRAAAAGLARAVVPRPARTRPNSRPARRQIAELERVREKLTAAT